MGGLTAISEERLDDGGAVGGEDTGGDFYLMIEAGVGEDFEAGTDGATFRIVGAVDEAGDAGLDDGAGAHAAGLDSDVERGISKTVVEKEAGGFAQDDDFGVGGGVAIADRAIASAGEDFPVMNEHGADGDFAGYGRGTSFGECFLHELDVGFHVGRENNTREERKRVQTQRRRVRREE
jgi:hypothetical protein